VAVEAAEPALAPVAEDGAGPEAAQDGGATAVAEDGAGDGAAPEEPAP
jgi:hypothetical protein